MIPIEKSFANPPFQDFNARFLKRTVLATVITLLLVAMVAAVYWSPAWAAYYLFAGIWSLIFLSLSPLVIKAFLFDRRRLLGLALVTVKLLWLGLMFAVCRHWSKTQGNKAMLSSALIAGLSTLFIVLVLRSLGSLMESQPKQKPPGNEPPPNHLYSPTPPMEPKP